MVGPGGNQGVSTKDKKRCPRKARKTRKTIRNIHERVLSTENTESIFDLFFVSFVSFVDSFSVDYFRHGPRGMVRLQSRPVRSPDGESHSHRSTATNPRPAMILIPVVRSGPHCRGINRAMTAVVPRRDTMVANLPFPLAARRTPIPPISTARARNTNEARGSVARRVMASTSMAANRVITPNQANNRVRGMVLGLMFMVLALLAGLPDKCKFTGRIGEGPEKNVRGRRGIRAIAFGPCPRARTGAGESTGACVFLGARAWGARPRPPRSNAHGNRKEKVRMPRPLLRNSRRSFIIRGVGSHT